MDWFWRSVCEPAAFWTMLTGVATAVLVFVAWKQLSALVRTSRADFVFRLKSEFFNEKSRRLIHLIENDLLEFVEKSDDLYYFVIKDFESPETKEKIGPLGFESGMIASQEADDLIPLFVLGAFGMDSVHERVDVVAVEN